ncbi:MAG: S-layer homology domain-containing protein, partial [Patescibacteria group bacterium]
SLTLPTETARKILEIREALLARFQMQLSDARKREEEREAAEAAFLEQDALATTEERRFARAQKLAQEKGSDRLSSPGKIAERRGLLSMVLGAQTVLYRDVPVTAWFAPYVSLLIEEDIAQGYKDDAGELTGEFGVANAVTRAEVLKMALEAADIPLTGGSPRNHSAQGTWASSYVAQAEAMQLSTVDPTTDVHAAATRGEVIQTIMEVMGITIGKTPSTFADVPATHPFTHAIAAAAFFGFITGDTSSDGSPLGTFRPEDTINRAEVSKIVALVRELMR